MSGTDRTEGYLTSFSELFTGEADRPTVAGIRIPLIQRDYAQGRPGPQVEEIRTTFLHALHSALDGGTPLGLDFVYGDVSGGTLLPLDGQQRLTTLFLLHWYLCVRAGAAPSEYAWSQFSYDTRPSARRFCERLVAFPPKPDQLALKAWITDQAWFLHGWQHDPTITSMLTVIDAIEHRFARTDASAAWQRLTDRDEPAVSFLLLPIEEIGAGDELYIKMNSRGKPLTPFENFKARFERLLDWAPAKAKDLAHKVDGSWSELLWPLRGDDDIVDDEFLRYFEFVIEVCEWRQDRSADSERLHERAAAIFYRDNPQVEEHLALLFNAFDVWSDHDDIAATFDRFFATSHRPSVDGGPQSVVLFGTDVRANLFAECCRSYGEVRGKSRVFSLSQTLLLYAVLLHRIHHTDDFPARLRILRNLLAASEDEVRRENMPKLVADVTALVLSSSRTGGLDDVKTFTKALTAAEKQKQQLLEEQPQLGPSVWRLEDHTLLRGALGAFDFDPDTLPRYAHAFDVLFSDTDNWKALTGALLAAGEYQRRRPNSEAWQFGTASPANDGVWRALLAGTREDLAPTRSALTTLLDGFDTSSLLPAGFLAEATRRWVGERRASLDLDWRYYLVAYDCMREGATGIYYGVSGELGYSMCMLRRTQLNSLYRDPFLQAIWEESRVGDSVIDPWFTGYPNSPRWLQLQRSGTGLRCVDAGLELTPPSLSKDRETFVAVCSERDDVVVEGEDKYVMVVSQGAASNGKPVDQEDRVLNGASLLKALVEAGL